MQFNLSELRVTGYVTDYELSCVLIFLCEQTTFKAYPHQATNCCCLKRQHCRSICQSRRFWQQFVAVSATKLPFPVFGNFVACGVDRPLWSQRHLIVTAEAQPQR